MAYVSRTAMVVRFIDLVFQDLPYLNLLSRALIHQNGISPPHQQRGWVARVMVASLMVVKVMVANPKSQSKIQSIS